MAALAREPFNRPTYLQARKVSIRVTTVKQPRITASTRRPVSARRFPEKRIPERPELLMMQIPAMMKANPGRRDLLKGTFRAPSHPKWSVTADMDNCPATERQTVTAVPRTLEIKDHYPKYVATLEDLAAGNVNGVKIMHLADFLLCENY